MPAPRDEGPRLFAWLIAALSVVLPGIGLVLMIAGASQLYRGGTYGWLLYAGAATLVFDLVLDLWWAHPSVSRSDEPDLNARARQLIGRSAAVEEPIRNGRGKVRIGDTVWPAEGPDCAAGTQVKITGTKGTALMIELDEAGR